MTETPKWSDLWGIDPTYDEDRIEEPTFTASELKERLETATTVALALGRKEAVEEAAVIVAAHWPTRTRGGYGLECCLDDLLNLTLRSRDAISQPNGPTSNGLTAVPASPGTPEESKPAESAFPDLPEGSGQ